MDNENQNSDSQLDASRTSAAGDAGAVDPASLSLDELNKALGKDFKDKDSALKSLKDTSSYVGKAKQTEQELRQQLESLNGQQKQNEANGTVDETVKSEISSLKNRLFFSENPQYKEYAPIIAKMGGDPAEVVGSEEFKKVFELGKTAAEAESARSVVSSNARVGVAPDLTNEAVKVANSRGATGTDVAGVFAAQLAKEIIDNA